MISNAILQILFFYDIPSANEGNRPSAGNGAICGIENIKGKIYYNIMMVTISDHPFHRAYQLSWKSKCILHRFMKRLFKLLAYDCETFIFTIG